MKKSTKLPVIDQHDRDGDIIGYAENAEEAATIMRNNFLKADPDADEIATFDASNAVYWYDKETEDFLNVEDADLEDGYWANP